MRAEKTGAEDPDGDIEASAGNSLHGLPRADRAEERLKFTHVLRKAIGAGWVAAKGAQRVIVSAGSAAQPEIDASGIERFKRSKLFGDHNGGVVGQHDSARANADGFGAAGNITDDD